MNDLTHIEAFEGKRNSVITLFIPPDLKFKKNLEGIERSVRAIKHSNKRGQILKVVNCISDRNSDRTTLDGTGMIVCCGINMQNSVEYYEVVPPNKVQTFEYYYDYVFNIQRIREVFNEDVIVTLTKEEELTKIEEINKHVASVDNMLVFGNHLDIALRSKMVQEIYYFSRDTMEDSFIKSARNAGTTIMKFDMDDYRNTDMAEKYGRIGLLYYPIDLS